MMGDVVQGKFITTEDRSPAQVLESTASADLESVVIVGFDKDGDMFFASSAANSAEVIYLLESAKHELFKMEDHLRATGDPRGRGT
jgi:hypothetical protein